MDALDNGDAAPVAAGEASAQSAVMGPQPDSPRTVWFRANRQKLDLKEEEEKKAKAEIQTKAKEFLKQFSEQRQKGIEERMKSNRAEEQSAREVSSGSQDGKLWEGIVSLINFNMRGQQKDTARLRTLLFQAREANLPVKGM